MEYSLADKLCFSLQKNTSLLEMIFLIKIDLNV